MPTTSFLDPQNVLQITFDEDILSTNVDFLSLELLDIYSDFSTNQKTTTRVCFDLEHCRMIDSRGMSLLMEYFKKFNPNGAMPIEVKVSSETIRRTFCFLKLDSKVVLNFTQPISQHKD